MPHITFEKLRGWWELPWLPWLPDGFDKPQNCVGFWYFVRWFLRPPTSIMVANQDIAILWRSGLSCSVRFVMVRAKNVPSLYDLEVLSFCLFDVFLTALTEHGWFASFLEIPWKALPQSGKSITEIRKNPRTWGKTWGDHCCILLHPVALCCLSVAQRDSLRSSTSNNLWRRLFHLWSDLTQLKIGTRPVVDGWEVCRKSWIKWDLGFSVKLVCRLSQT